MASALGSRVAALITGPIVQSIDFTFEYDPGVGGFRVDGKGFGLVARAIWEGDGDIGVVRDPTRCPIDPVKGTTTEGKYDWDNNIIIFRDGNPDEGVIVHESTHAVLDIIKIMDVRYHTAEAAAWLAQLIYERLAAGEEGHRKAFVGILGAADQVAKDAKIFTEQSVEVPFGKPKKDPILVYHRGIVLNHKQYEPLREAVKNGGYGRDFVVYGFMGGVKRKSKAKSPVPHHRYW